jgi:5-formyltetrahydrofolate cyclo-ligase
MEALKAQKSKLRTELRARRRTAEPKQLAKDSEALCQRLLELPELQCAQTVFCYVSCGGEVQTRRFIAHLLAAGKRVAVPRCGKNGAMDAVCISSLEELQPAMMGIPEPPAHMPAIAFSEIDFAVVPAVACGEDGSRLGQGGGYYDRFLEKTSCAFAAVCLEEYLFPTLPFESHDRFMKIIVTQQRVLRFEEV